jgi:hypothetical protein
VTGMGRGATKRTSERLERVDSRDGTIETAKNSMREKRAYSRSNGQAPVEAGGGQPLTTQLAVVALCVEIEEESEGGDEEEEGEKEGRGS